MTKKELSQKVDSIRSLKALLEETNNEIKALENEVVAYMKDNNLAEEFTDSAKITYTSQTRTSLDKAKLVEIFGSDLKPFEKVTSYNVLRIK